MDAPDSQCRCARVIPRSLAAATPVGRPARTSILAGRGMPAKRPPRGILAVPSPSSRAGVTLMIQPPGGPARTGARDECGVFAIYAPGEDVARYCYYGLYALQHRGQESAGIAVSDGEHILVTKEMGLVNQVFDNRRLAGLNGHLAIGHVRYSTTGASTWSNAQPTFKVSDAGRSIALSHNGNLVATGALSAELGARGAACTSDSDLLATLVAHRAGTSS